MALFESIQSTWQELRAFFSAEADEVREIERARDPARYRPGGFGHQQGGMFDQYGEATRLYHDLHARFIDYEQMDDYPELASSLDMYADEATAPDFMRNRRIWVESDNENISAELNHLLDVLESDDDLWSLTRYTCKYGNDYERVFVGANGVVSMEPLPPALTRRVHDEHGQLLGYVVSMNSDYELAPEQFRQLLQRRSDPRFTSFSGYMAQGQTAVFEPWEVVHFRLHGKDRMSKYGYSLFEPARWPFKRLTMMEDAVVVHKLTRAPSRYVFYVNTGDMSPQESLAYTGRVRDMFKKQKYVDPKTGGLNFGYNTLAVDEDFFIPVHREMGEQVRVDSLSGPDYQATDDVSYFLRKIGAGMKIPSFGREDDGGDGPLSFKDIRFAAQVMRVQRAIIRGYRHICAIHLVATGRDYRDFNYDVYMPVPSAILELARMEVLSAKADLISRLDEWVSIRWLMVSLFGFSEDEATRLMVMREEEKDFASAADIQRDVERDVGREKALASIRESASSDLADQLQERWEQQELAGRVPLQHYREGSSPDPEKILRELRQKDPALHRRINELNGLMKEIKRNTERIEMKSNMKTVYQPPNWSH